jgi:hypothetical protein
MIKMLSTVLIASFLFSACSNDLDDCADVICTQDFRSIMVTLTDSMGNPTVADRTETYLKSGIMLRQTIGEGVPDSNRYVVADDNNKYDVERFQPVELVFRIYKNGSMVRELPFVVKTDCCHIEKVSGVSDVVIP